MKKACRRRRVLVVEPDGEFCSLLCEFLEAQKFEVDTAHDAAHCLKKVEAFKPDILVLSRELPMNGGTIGPDGLRVLKTVKQMKTRIPVIMFSGEASEADFDRYRKLKFTADDYVRKPFEDTEILRRIENLVGFDFSDDIDRLQENIDDAMDDPLAKLFEADPEELGPSSVTRKEVSWLLEQVGRELDLQEDSEAEEEKAQAAQAPAKPAEAEGPEKEIALLKAEIQKLSHQLDLERKQLVSERKRSRDIKKEWKQRLTEIESELRTSEEREGMMREEFEKMRIRFADMELDHTMELERVQAEKRRALEDLSRMQPNDYSPEQVAEDIRRAALMLEEMLKKLSGSD